MDYVILNTKKPGLGLIESYKKENADLVDNDEKEIENLGVKIIKENILEDVKEKKILWEKKNLLRHDSDKIAKILIGLIQ